MKTMYPKKYPGQEVEVDWKNLNLRMACCDCLLVHELQFTVKDNKVIVQAWRDNRRTAALRRYRGIPIVEKENRNER